LRTRRLAFSLAEKMLFDPPPLPLGTENTLKVDIVCPPYKKDLAKPGVLDLVMH